MMVAVAFAVGRDVHQLCALSAVGLRSRAKSADQALGEILAAVQQAFEGDGAGARPVVEKDGDAAALLRRTR